MVPVCMAWAIFFPFQSFHVKPVATCELLHETQGTNTLAVVGAITLLSLVLLGYIAYQEQSQAGIERGLYSSTSSRKIIEII